MSLLVIFNFGTHAPPPPAADPTYAGGTTAVAGLGGTLECSDPGTRALAGLGGTTACTTRGSTRLRGPVGGGGKTGID